MADEQKKAYDPNFKYDVAAQPGGEQIKVCFSCGTCTAGCPVTDVDARYSPRKIIRQILLGQREAVLSNELLWYCETCYTCSAYCPQNVKFGDVMRAIREMAVAEGYWTPEFLQRVRNVDRLAHELRLDLVRAALRTSSEAGAVSIESAAEVVSDKIKKASV
ncbi:MAG: CoB--CoM heterodisulfide reductase subunit C [Chloroflexi bacterium]|jgi:heterodisulfide reductase subunit C|nr:CoB--CoM heterodisulfide reductase subunit C [Chloroflexota bacterium]